MNLKSKMIERGFDRISLPFGGMTDNPRVHGLLTNELYVVGYWTDAGMWGDLQIENKMYGHTYAELPHPKDWVDSDWDAEERARVIDYLDNGSSLILHLGVSSCRFGCERNGLGMGTKDFTDGVWIYPEGYSHYLKVHDVKPPEAFLEHIRSNAYEQPKLVKTPVSQEDADNQLVQIARFEQLTRKVRDRQENQKEQRPPRIEADEEGQCANLNRKTRTPWWKFW